MDDYELLNIQGLDEPIVTDDDNDIPDQNPEADLEVENDG